MANQWGVALVLFGVCALAHPAAAQVDDEPRSTLAVTLYGGGAAFSDLQRRSVLYAVAGEEARQFDQAVSAAPAVFGGLHVAFWPSPTWGIRATYSATRSHFETYSLERGGSADATDPAAAPARLSMHHIGGDFIFRLPIRVRRVGSYAFLGAGRTTYMTGEPESDAALRTTPRERSRVTGTIGAGARVPLQRERLSLEFELASYVGRAPWSADEVRSGDVATIQMKGESEVPEVSLVNHARLSVGLRYVVR